MEVDIHIEPFGWFYPEMGIMLFSGAELSASIPGAPHFGTPILPVTASKNSVYFTKTVLEGAANPFARDTHPLD